MFKMKFEYERRFLENEDRFKPYYDQDHNYVWGRTIRVIPQRSFSKETVEHALEVIVVEHYLFHGSGKVMDRELFHQWFYDYDFGYPALFKGLATHEIIGASAGELINDWVLVHLRESVVENFFPWWVEQLGKVGKATG